MTGDSFIDRTDAGKGLVQPERPTTSISQCSPDIEEQMERLDALEFGIIALDDKQREYETAGRYELATSCFVARQVLERMRDEEDAK